MNRSFSLVRIGKILMLVGAVFTIGFFISSQLTTGEGFNNPSAFMSLALIILLGFPLLVIGFIVALIGKSKKRYVDDGIKRH